MRTLAALALAAALAGCAPRQCITPTPTVELPSTVTAYSGGPPLVDGVPECEAR